MKAIKRSIILLILASLLVQFAGLGNAIPTPAYAALSFGAQYEQPALPANGQVPEEPTTNVTRIFWHETTGLPPSLSGNATTAPALGLSETEAKEPTRLAQAFLQVFATTLGMDESARQWNLERTDSDNTGVSHIRFNQRYNDLPVFAADLIVHVAGTQVVAVNG